MTKADYISLVGEFIQKNRGLYAVYLAVLLVFPAEALVFPHVFSHAMSKVQTSKSPSMQDLSKVAALWIGVQVLYLVMSAIDFRLVPRFVAFARERVMHDVIYGFDENFTEPDTGELMSAIHKLPEAARDLFYEMHHAVFADFLLFVFTIGYYFWINVTLGLVFLAGMVAWCVITYFFHSSCASKTYDKERSHDKIHSKMEDIVANLVSVFVYDSNVEELAKLKADSCEYMNLVRSSMSCTFSFRVMYAVLVVVVFFAIMWTAVGLVRDKTITQPVFVAVFIVTFTTMTRMMAGYNSVRDLLKTLGIVHSTSTAVNETVGFDDKPPRDKPEDTGETVQVDDITLKDVVYEVPGRTILDGVSCTFARGKTSAIVGKSGSGKSTVTRLLLRLDRPTGGDIMTGGRSIYSIPLSSWRREVAYVPQKPRLFDRTLRENLAYGGIADPEKAVSILRSIGMAEMADIFETRMDESVGKGGNKLSGGQCQIVFLLRALMSNADVVVLDEPSSALDYTSRDSVVRFINTAMKGRTMIIITHDQTLMGSVDDVFEMSDGKLTKRGKTGWR